MMKVETDHGAYAVKVLNPRIMKRETAVGKFIFSENVARTACLNQIPAITTIDSHPCLNEVEGRY
ncbi:hypothetical protein ACFQI7_22975 [Paenibacillus allorhizosphaerae]|nr:hypothetical protein [Paenibacillus allorhizosphaerae]